jgi:hypothetical protein
MADPDKRNLNPSGGSVANRRKANEMIAIIENPTFWHALARYESKLFIDSLYDAILFFGTDSKHISNLSLEPQIYHRLLFAGWTKFS